MPGFGITTPPLSLLFCQTLPSALSQPAIVHPADDALKRTSDPPEALSSLITLAMLFLFPASVPYRQTDWQLDSER